jgi:hypothetical protein
VVFKERLRNIFNFNEETKMPKARKKPVDVDYVQWTGKNLEEVFLLTGTHEIRLNDFLSDDLTIPTLEGEMTAKKGDYIIKGVVGEIYPCKPDIFEATYDFPV